MVSGYPPSACAIATRASAWSALRWAIAASACGRHRVRCGGGVVLARRRIHPPVPADPAHPLHPQHPQREVAVVDVVLRRGDGGQVRVAGGGTFVAGRCLDDTRQRDAAAGQRIGFPLRRDDRDAGARVGGEVAAVLGEIGHTQHRCSAEQPVGDERRPRIAVGSQRRQCARIGRCGDRARFFGGRRANGICDSGQWGRDRRGIARVAMITGRHVGTIPNCGMDTRPPAKLTYALNRSRFQQQTSECPLI